MRTKFQSAFTLIEIMVVVSIMGICMAVGVPAFVRALHKEGMRKAQSDLLQACKAARGQAIIEAHPVDLTFHPLEGTFEVSGAFPTAKLGDQIGIDLLGVNEIQYEREETARVRFYPNGTSDEFVIVIHDIRGGMVKISLDPVTALADIENVR